MLCDLICLFFRYHLKDVIVGKIYFLLVRIKIKHMEIAIIKRETTGSGPNTFTDNLTIAKYEIMDGAPVRGNLFTQLNFVFSYLVIVCTHNIFSGKLKKLGVRNNFRLYV